MYKIVKSDDGNFRQITESKSANNLITKEISSTMSLATTEGVNFYEKEVTKYNRIYYVIEGELELGFDGTFSKLSIGDSCYIDAQTEYEMRGTFKAIVVNQPAYGTASQI